MRLDGIKATVPEEKKAEFAKAAYQLHLMAKCVGWPFVTKMIMDSTPRSKGHNKRRHKKRCKRMLLRYIGDTLREAGLQVERRQA